MRNYLDEETLEDEYKKASAAFFGKKDRKRYLLVSLKFLIVNRTLQKYLRLRFVEVQMRYLK